MNEYTKFVLDSNSKMPDPTKDIIRFSKLHSWYKHLGKFEKAYPLLAQGEEPRYDFDPSYTDLNQNNFHWRIILEYNMTDYKIMMPDGNCVQISDDVMSFMKRFPIYLNNTFSPDANFQILNCQQMCNEFWNGMVAHKIINIAETKPL